MCGIAGYVSSSDAFNNAVLRKMTAALAHRGPDAEGFFTEERVGMGHRRLSILDLSPAANQPMISHCGRYAMVYNGEVFNFRELADEMGIPMNTTSDTEVILEAFIRYGYEFMQRLNGMFALAICDRQKKELFLCRDRLGVKPLFYYLNDKDFAFASELKGLTAVDTISKNTEINRQAVSEFLYLGYIPEPATIHTQIFKFPAGHYAVLNEHGFSLSSYWQPEQKITATLCSDEVSAITQLDALFNASVHYRLISDVPFGVFLSGGTDSSLVAAVAQKQSPVPVNTFSIGFEEARYNEAEYAKAVSGFLGTRHHEFIVSYKDAINLFEEITDTYDEPYADASAIPTMLVSKLARQHVKMVLSGDGGDELFFGYGAHKWAGRLANPAVRKLRKPIASALSCLSNREKRAAALFRYPSQGKFKSHVFSQEQYFFSEKEINQLLSHNFRNDIALNESFSGLPRMLTPAEAQALFDLKFYLRDDLLVKVDRASMKYGLEVRVPFLDYRIVEFALNIAPGLKLKKGESKYLLKQLLYTYVPEKYFNRPKQGFALPVQKWLGKELRFLLEDYLSDSLVKELAIVDSHAVMQLKVNYLNGKSYLFNRLWALIVLHKYFKNIQIR